MARHTFKFAGGDDLTTIGAVWFVSYSYYLYIDRNHLNWQSVKTYQNRICTFNRTISLHNFWLGKCLEMNEINLNKNKIGLQGSRVKQMAKDILTKFELENYK